MTSKTDELQQYLQGTLAELDRLAEQVRKSHDFSESAELVLCLRELVAEQLEPHKHEDPCSPACAAG